jgi:hypothetical protein
MVHLKTALKDFAVIVYIKKFINDKWSLKDFVNIYGSPLYNNVMLMINNEEGILLWKINRKDNELENINTELKFLCYVVNLEEKSFFLKKGFYKCLKTENDLLNIKDLIFVTI